MTLEDPDGEWIVFGGIFGPDPALDSELFVTKADGSGNATMLTNTPNAGETHPEFSPDGTKLAFVSNRDDDGDGRAETDNDIYVMDAAPEGPFNVAVNLADGMVDALTGATTNERFPAWSPDGDQIAVWSGLGGAVNPVTQRPGIWLMYPDGTGTPTKITNPLLIAPTQPDWGPAAVKKMRSSH